MKQWFTPTDLTERYVQRSQWTRDVLKLMLVVIGISTVIILAGVVAGLFSLLETLPIYIVLLLVVIAKVGSRRGGWRWARFFPSLMCMGLGFYGSYNYGFGTAGVFYVLTVLLAGMLINLTSQRIFVIISIGLFTYFGIEKGGGDFFNNLDSIITYTAAVTGTALLQWYYEKRFCQELADRIAVNQALAEEVDRRQQAEISTKDNENRLERLTQNISDLITEISPDGIIKYASPSYIKTLGYIPELVIGTDAFALVHPEDIRSGTSALVDANHRRSPGRQKLRVKHAEGHYITVEVYGAPIPGRDGEPEGFVLTSREIPGQIDSDENDSLLVTDYQAVVASLPMGIHFYTLLEDGDLILTGYNPAAEQLLNLDHTKLVGKSIEHAFASLVYTGIPDMFRNVALTGETWQNGVLHFDDENQNTYFSATAFQTSHGKMVVLFQNSTDYTRAE